MNGFINRCRNQNSNEIRPLHNHHKRLNKIGDRLIDLCIVEQGGDTTSIYRTNEYLSLINVPVRDKRKNFKKGNLSRSKEDKADVVEWYIGFLYSNYGISKAKQFIHKNIFRI